MISSDISGLGVLRQIHGASLTKSDSVDAELLMEEALLVLSCGLPPRLPRRCGNEQMFLFSSVAVLTQKAILVFVVLSFNK